MHIVNNKMCDHPFYVAEHPKSVIDRTLEIVNASKRKTIYCTTHGEEYPLCLSPQNINIKYKVNNGYNIVRTDKYVFNGVFHNNVMLFGFMYNYKGINKDRSLLCRATIGGEILSETITVGYSGIQELSYSSFCFNAMKKKELWCYKSSTSQMCVDSIFFEKTERTIEIWCESSEYRIILFNGADAYGEEYALCGIPIYDKNKRAYAISGRGWSQLPDNINERLKSCNCVSLGGCSCIVSIKPTSTVSIWGCFNKEGQPHGDVHIKHKNYNFVGQYKNGKWHGEGYLDLTSEHQIWRGLSYNNIFEGIVMIKEWFASKLIGIIAGKCAHDNFKINTIMGEYIKFKYSHFDVDSYYKGHMTLNKNEITELYGYEACTYNFYKQLYIQNFNTHTAKLLPGFIEKSAYEKYKNVLNTEALKIHPVSFKDTIKEQCGELSYFKNLAYDLSIPMYPVQIAYKIDGTFEIFSEYFPDYSGQIKIYIDDNTCWEGFLWNKQPTKYRVLL